MTTPETTLTITSTPIHTAPGGSLVLAPEKKKKKKKYSRGLKDIQGFDRSLAKATRRINQAVADGMKKYLKESNKSARKRRDGAIYDALQNWSRAMGKTTREASSVPKILTSTVNTRTARRQFRTLVRLTMSPFYS